MITRILIPLDGSKTAEQVVPYARAFARGLKLPVELLAVVDVGALLTSVETARFFDNLAEQESHKSKEYLERIAERFAGSRVKRSVEQGSAAEVIIEKAAADESTLIAMTTHGRSGLKRWLLGSVTEKVLRAATNPLLLVRAVHEGKTEGEATLKSIVVPLDGSELAEHALPTVIEIAKKLRLEVFLFRAYSNPYGSFTGGAGLYAANLDALMASVRDEARNYLEEKMAELGKQGVDETFLSTTGRCCARRDCFRGKPYSRESDRHGLPRAVRRETLGLGQRNGNRSAPLRQSGARFAAGHTERRMMSWIR